MTKRNTLLNNDRKRIIKTYEEWLQKADKGPVPDPDAMEELEKMRGDGARIEDAFYRDLAFGTGGLRGVLGPGPNRMNVHTVARASQGLANYVIGSYHGWQKSRHGGGRYGWEGCREEDKTQDRGWGIAVSYDSRIKSSLFARIACQVFAANGIRAYLYPELMPTPCLSFAVRRLGCAAGVMVTASHNPKEYNGYKVYGKDGCQITVEAADEIYGEIKKLDIFDGIRIMEFQKGLERGLIEYISQDVSTDFIQAVKAQSVLGNAAADKNIPIVYSPLNGAGREPVLRALRESGYGNITVVREQEEPDGDFPTCPIPNPETKAAMSLGIEWAKRTGAVLVLATDPDCDRAGIAVRDGQGGYAMLTGNETGILLLDYICGRRVASGTMPKAPVMVKTIVTTDMGERIADRYGVETINVLTGFKFIGEQIGMLEAEGRAEDFIFGFEESHGYLSGSYVRDKDGVGAALLICEMCAYYGARGVNLGDKLNGLYEIYGFRADRLHSYLFPGMEGAERMAEVMENFRQKTFSFGGMKVTETIDYSLGASGLPKSDVLKFVLGQGGSVVIRPSGTEPKLKAYVSVCAKSRDEAEKLEKEIAADLRRKIEG